MNKINPIYTVDAECQDCFKCIRLCPVKAIKVEDGHAKIVPELCISCGNCVKVCPAHAKHVRDDLPNAREIVRNSPLAVAALAPSWVSEFDEYSKKEMVSLLESMGFYGVSEIAAGAREVSEWTAEKLNELNHGIYFSSACTAVVDFIGKYHKKHKDNILDISSPVMCHSKLLKKKYGDDLAVIMIGPCVAKKNESDRDSEELDIVITFQDLRRWMDEDGIKLHDIDINKKAEFILEEKGEGRLYPLEGGMYETVKYKLDRDKVKSVILSGINNIDKTLQDLDNIKSDKVIFIEALSCKGGCINGPCMTNPASELNRTLKVHDSVEKVQHVEKQLEFVPTYNCSGQYIFTEEKFSSTEIAKALESIGKRSVRDELNCDGCGYETCRNFALALLEKKAEVQMCVSYMRNMAQKKANALIRSIPAGIVIVDNNMQIVECNRHFAGLFDETTVMAFDAKPGLNGAMLEKIVPFAGLFESVLLNSEEAVYKSYKCDESYYDIIVFNIDKGNVVGGVIFDVTGADLKRGQIVEKANTVINRNVLVVQEIAGLLGEQMAETEIILRSIADAYSKRESSYKEIEIR